MTDSDDRINKVVDDMVKAHTKLYYEAYELLEKHGESAVDYLTEDHRYVIATANGVPVESTAFSDGSLRWHTAVPIAIRVVNGKYQVIRGSK